MAVEWTSAITLPIHRQVSAATALSHSQDHQRAAAFYLSRKGERQKKNRCFDERCIVVEGGELGDAADAVRCDHYRRRRQEIDSRSPDAGAQRRGG